MKRLGFIAAGALLFGFGFASSLQGCGGDDASTGGGGDGGASGDGTVGTGDDGGGGGDGGTSTDSGGGGTGSNPGEVSCGPSLTCPVDVDAAAAGSRPYCCEERDGGDSCETSGAACGAGSRLECDEPADCPSNRHDCCMQTNSIGPGPDAGFTTGQSACADHCGGNDLVLCKTASDCDGGACNQVTCRGGVTFYACNTNDDCK